MIEINNSNGDNKIAHHKKTGRLYTVLNDK